jgi:L-ectoine synthase
MLSRMIVRTIDEIAGTERDVSGEGWRSRRLIRRDDGVEHSVHYTEITAGTEQRLWYKNHYETNLCIAGEGEVVDVATGATHPISPGTMYVLDQHDRHILRAHTHLVLVCTFWPALSGGEKHDADGSYLPAADSGH